MFVNLPKFLSIPTIKRKIASYVIFMKMKIWIVWSSMSFQNLVRLSQIKKKSLPDYAHVNKVSKK
jgi:hypothetical protein